MADSNQDQNQATHTEGTSRGMRLPAKHSTESCRLGRERIKCSGLPCRIPCRHMPGMLVAGDLEPMAKAAGYDSPLTFCQR